ncbi:hypothetical protein CJA_0944 [Cellvibrio japonicus Ueda107]|uniref:Peptidase A2 domain-containing protein n=2 Tax=Cellvibrio japonicus TaxID=155077 RepID=B3PLC0_CELJU|nr:hypothetical protein CJA_0944 [Cellvibrio japonicus Ueda107]
MVVAFAAGVLVTEYRYRLQVPPAAHTVVPPEVIEPAISPAPTQSQPPAALPGAEAPLWDEIQRLLAGGDQVQAAQSLRRYLQQHPQSAPAWLLLAQVQQQLGRQRESVDAWFQYLRYELDAAKVEGAIQHLKQYLLKLAQSPSLFGEERLWLIEQINNLIKLTADDGELHLALANLHLNNEDRDQAQYHALMAVNHPQSQPQAEAILAKLNGDQIDAALGETLEIPLTRYGNQFLVEVSIEGNSARLLLDTGASLSGVTSRYLEQHPYLVKNRKPIQLNTASGSVDSYLFTVEQLNLASIPFHKHLLAHLPMGDTREFDGLLGVDILGRFDFVIDQSAARLRLSKRAE